MQADPSGLPPWLVFGLLLGVAGSLVVAALFLVAGRLFPAKRQAQGVRDGGETRRRGEIREYLTTIDEQFADNHPIAG